MRARHARFNGFSDRASQSAICPIILKFPKRWKAERRLKKTRFSRRPPHQKNCPASALRTTPAWRFTRSMAHREFIPRAAPARTRATKRILTSYLANFRAEQCGTTLQVVILAQGKLQTCATLLQRAFVVWLRLRTKAS